jgi:putative FmdB family regulatory protein
MPLFEYCCITCGSRFEKLEKAGSEGEVECPGCGSTDVKKELSTFATSGASSPAGGCFSGG